DNLIAKVLVHATDRDTAIDRLARALDEIEVGGVQTTVPFHRFVAASESFRAADVSTGWVDAQWNGPAERRRAVERALLAAGLDALEAGHGSNASGAALAPASAGAAAASPGSSGGWGRLGRAAAI